MLVCGFIRPQTIIPSHCKAVLEQNTGPVSYTHLVTVKESASGGRIARFAEVDEEICLGCGVCARNCPTKAIRLERRPVQIITPVNSTHRFVLQAIEKGTLQNLVFDNQAFASHRAMAAQMCIRDRYFTIVPDFKSVGVRDNARCFEYPVIIRAVNTVDAMSATIEQIDWPVLLKITDRIMKEVKNVNRVCYDLSPKPNATIEWE